MAADEAMFPVAETSGGRIRGIANCGVRIFRGIPYGADTANCRYQAPRPHAPWAGVRDCFGPGPAAPQVSLPLTSIFSQLIQYDLSVANGGMSEDCLSLNVWAPRASDVEGLPVVVILHGGGYAHSTGNALLYDGGQLALAQNLVVVSVNHRLGSFGFLGLAGLDRAERFAAAGHCGLLDIILALRWVRENAEAFGGDRDRVTLIGESGGGWKVSALMAMPAARGLFHRAVVQSGSGPGFLSVDQGEELAAALCTAAGVDRADPAALLAIDFTRLVAAQAHVGPVAFLPVIDDRALPMQMLDPGGLAVSRDIPLIVSTTLDDAGLFFTDYDLDEAGLLARLEAQFGPAAAARLQALYRAQRPTKSAYLLHAEIITDAGFRRYAHRQAAGRAGLGGAPVWMYRWDWPSPACDGLFGAAHAMDVSASLAHGYDSLLGGGVAAGRALTATLSGVVGRFAASGDPRGAALADWPPYTVPDRHCLLLGAEMAVAADPDAGFRQFWDTMPAPASLLG